MHDIPTTESIPSSILDKWVYIDNKKWGRLFAADQDYIGENFHMLETDQRASSSKTGYKYHFKISFWSMTDGPTNEVLYNIYNREYGYVAPIDQMIEDCYYVGCSSKVRNEAVTGNGYKSPFFFIEAVNNYYRFKNDKVGNLFSADLDKMGWGHIVECDDIIEHNHKKIWNPQDKYQWTITPI